MKTIATILLLLVSIPSAWGEERLADRLARSGYPREVAARVQALLDAAENDGLPTEPLRQKALEGVAKRVPAVRLVEALQLQRARLAALQKAAPGAVAARPVQQAALTAMAGGLSAATVADLQALAGDAQRMQSALYATGVLNAAGAGEGEAVAFVKTQLRAALRPGQMDDATRTAARALAAGLVSGEDLAAVQPEALKGSAFDSWLHAMRGFSRPAHPARDAADALQRDELQERAGETRAVEEIRARSQDQQPRINDEDPEAPGEPDDDDRDDEEEDPEDPDDEDDSDLESQGKRR